MSKHHKILLVSNTLQSFSLYRRDLIVHLKQRGYTVIAAAPPGPHIQDLGVEVLSFPLSRSGMNPFAEFRSLFFLLVLILRTRPDVMIGYTIKPVTYLSLLGFIIRRPVIAVVTGMGYSFITSSWPARIARWVFLILLSGARHILYLNEQDRQTLETFLPRLSPKLKYLPGEGIDTTAFTPTSPLDTNLPVTFLIISRVLRDKGVVEYARAAARVRAQNLPARFLFLGELDPGNPAALNQKEWQSLVTESGIEPLGFQQDVRPFIASCDVMVLPSYREGLPRVLLEAGAMGKPVITTDVPGCRDLVTDGVNGFLVPAKDEVALANAMQRMQALHPQERERMGQNFRDKVISTYANNTVFKIYDQLIQEVLHDDP